MPNNLVNTELDLNFFKRNFTPEFITKNVERITFCGDDGDPIYAHEFLDVVKYIKSIKNVSLHIFTNGSYKKIEWWKELASSLNEQDQLHFSLDGWDQASNEQYRVNSNWDSIMLGINTIRKNSNCHLVWDAIGFKFNENKIEDMKEMAKSLGFDLFQLTKSTKFGAKYPGTYGTNDTLEPVSSLISSTHRFERVYTQLSSNVFAPEWTETNLEFFKKLPLINDSIKPLCHVGIKGLFINSKGEFYPCCWVANRYSHNTYWQDLGKKFNLYDNLLEDVISMNFWEKDFVNDSLECRLKCNKNVVTEKYAT
jgi:MoaA/NifB/PqqE/SkfB family radical SAM enzyme